MESNTCIVEKMDGELSLLGYPDFLKELSKKRAVQNLNDSVSRINASKEEYPNLSVAA